jgi:hypothetical protein
LLTNRLQEATEIDFELFSIIKYQGSKYRIIGSDQASQLSTSSDPERTSQYLRQGDRGFQYTENEIYCLFKKPVPHS